MSSRPISLIVTMVVPPQESSRGDFLRLQKATRVNPNHTLRRAQAECHTAKFVFTELNQCAHKVGFCVRSRSGSRKSFDIHQACQLCHLERFIGHNELTVVGRFRHRGARLECSEVTNSRQRDRKRSKCSAPRGR